EYVWGIEALRPHAVGRDTALDERVDHVACILFLRVPVEGHGYLWRWGLELGREVAVAWERVNEGNVAVQRHHSATRVIEFGAPNRRAVLVFFDVFGTCIEAVLFAAEGLVLGDCDVARAAERVGLRGCIGRRERNGTFLGQIRTEE